MRKRNGQRIRSQIEYFWKVPELNLARLYDMKSVIIALRVPIYAFYGHFRHFIPFWPQITWAVQNHRKWSKMNEPVSRFITIFFFLNVTLIKINWPMPCCWTFFRAQRTVQIQDSRNAMSDVERSNPCLHYQFRHVAWRHYIANCHIQVALQGVS